MIYPIKNNEQILAGTYNLLILFSGTITIEKEGVVNTVPPKSYFFFDTGFDIIAASPYVEGFSASLKEEELDLFPDLANELAGITAFFQPSYIKNLEDKKNKIKSFLEAAGNSRLSESYTHILWSEFIKDHKDKQQVKTTIDQFSELIDQNIEQNYCAGTYAEMMGIPLKKLIKEVKKYENKTPCNFITEKVIEKAKYKLLHTNDTSQMIAYQLGFDDPYYFIKYFKKNTGLTPTQYRAENLTME